MLYLLRENLSRITYPLKMSIFKISKFNREGFYSELLKPHLVQVLIESPLTFKFISTDQHQVFLRKIGGRTRDQREPSIVEQACRWGMAAND